MMMMMMMIVLEVALPFSRVWRDNDLSRLLSWADSKTNPPHELIIIIAMVIVVIIVFLDIVIMIILSATVAASVMNSLIAILIRYYGVNAQWRCRWKHDIAVFPFLPLTQLQLPMTSLLHEGIFHPKLCNSMIPCCNILKIQFFSIFSKGRQFEAIIKAGTCEPCNHLGRECQWEILWCKTYIY